MYIYVRKNRRRNWIVQASSRHFHFLELSFSFRLTLDLFLFRKSKCKIYVKVHIDDFMCVRVFMHRSPSPIYENVYVENVFML